jgi:molybdopterin biosynthesis enzyme
VQAPPSVEHMYCAHRLSRARPLVFAARSRRFHSSAEYVSHLEATHATLPQVRPAQRSGYRVVAASTGTPLSLSLASHHAASCTQGFRVGTASFRFVPTEAPLPNTMTLTLIVPDEPTERWGAVFTRVRCDAA